MEAEALSVGERGSSKGKEAPCKVDGEELSPVVKGGCCMIAFGVVGHCARVHRLSFSADQRMQSVRKVPRRSGCIKPFCAGISESQAQCQQSCIPSETFLQKKPFPECKTSGMIANATLKEGTKPPMPPHRTAISSATVVGKNKRKWQPWAQRGISFLGAKTQRNLTNDLLPRLCRAPACFS